MAFSQAALSLATGGLSSAGDVATNATNGVVNAAMPLAAPLVAGSLMSDAMLTKSGSRGSSETSHVAEEKEQTAFLQQAKQDRRVFFYQTTELRQFKEAADQFLKRLNRDIVPYRGFNVLASEQMGFFRKLFAKVDWADSIVSVQHMDIDTCHNSHGRAYHSLFMNFLDAFKDSRAFTQSQAKMHDPRYFMILGLYNGMLLIHERFKDNAAERLTQLNVMLEFCDYIAQQSNLGLGSTTRLVEAAKGSDTTSEFIRLCGDARTMIERDIRDATKKADIQKIQTSLGNAANEVSNLSTDIHTINLSLLSERDPGEDIFVADGNRSALHKDSASLATVLKDTSTSASFRDYFRGREKLYKAVKTFASPERAKLLEQYDESVSDSDRSQIRAYAGLLEQQSGDGTLAEAPRLLTEMKVHPPERAENKDHALTVVDPKQHALTVVDPAYLQLNPTAQKNKRAYEANLRASEDIIDEILDILPPHLKSIYNSTDELCRSHHDEMQTFLDTLRLALKSSLNLDNIRDYHNYMSQMASMAGVYTPAVIEAFLREGCAHAEAQLNQILSCYTQAVVAARKVATTFRLYKTWSDPFAQGPQGYYNNVIKAASRLDKARKKIKDIYAHYEDIRRELLVGKSVGNITEFVKTGSLLAGRLALEGIRLPFSPMLQHTRAATAMALAISQRGRIATGPRQQTPLLTSGSGGTLLLEEKGDELVIDVSDSNSQRALVLSQPQQATRRRSVTSGSGTGNVSMIVEEVDDDEEEKQSDHRKSSLPPALSLPSLAQRQNFALEPLSLALPADAEVSRIPGKTTQQKLIHVEQQRTRLQEHQTENKRAITGATQALQQTREATSVAQQAQARIAETRNSAAYSFLNSPGWGWRCLRWFPVLGWLAWLVVWLAKGTQCKESILAADEAAVGQQLRTLPQRERELQQNLEGLNANTRHYPEQLKIIEANAMAVQQALSEERRALSAKLQAPQTQAALFDSSMGFNASELQLLRPDSSIAASLAGELIKKLEPKMKDEIRAKGLSEQAILIQLQLALRKVPDTAQYQHPNIKRLIYQNVVEQLRNPPQPQAVAAVKR